MNPPEDKLEKVAMVLDRAMRYLKTLRFRQFYARNTRSGEFGELSASTQCKRATIVKLIFMRSVGANSVGVGSDRVDLTLKSNQVGSFFRRF